LGVKCAYAPRITNELWRNIEQLFIWGWIVPQVMDMHLKQWIQARGPDCPFNCSDILPWSIKGAMDDKIGFKDLHNIQAKVAKETYKFHTYDQQFV
jgi:hypothetical protein